MPEEMADAKNNIANYVFDRLIELTAERNRASYNMSHESEGCIHKDAIKKHDEMCSRIDELLYTMVFLAEQFD